MKQFYLALDLKGREPQWEEVTEGEFIRAEQAAGFIPKPGFLRATAGFGGNGVRGKIKERRT